MIPKRISFFWGGGPLSWMRYMTFRSFRTLHPDWDMHLFLATAKPGSCRWETGETQDCMGAAGAVPSDHFHELAALGVHFEPWIPPGDYANASPVHMADLCRWGVLSKFGGWFCDTDVLWIDSLDSLIDSPEDGHPEADVAMPICYDWLPTGLIGAAPETKFTGELYLAARASMDPRRYRSAGSEVIGRVCGFDAGYANLNRKTTIRAITAKFPGLSFWFMPPASVYTWQWFDAPRIFNQDEAALSKSLAIHWNGGSRAGQKFNRLYTAANFRDHNRNTFTHFAANLIDGTGE